MKDSVISVESGEGLRKSRRRFPLAVIALSLAMSAGGSWGNGLNENASWQFQTMQDRVNKSAVLDQIEKKKGGYYDAIKSTYNYNTYIDRQVNCSLSAGTTANSGSTSATASTSSPTVSNAGTTSSNTAANSASNGVAQSGLDAVLVTGTGATPTGSVSNGQSNTGALGSGVSGSNTSAATGAVTAGAGTTDQALNSQQSNTGALSASISSSTACSGVLN